RAGPELPDAARLLVRRGRGRGRASPGRPGCAAHPRPALRHRGLPAWAQITGGAAAVRASVVDICAPDGTGSGCAGGKPADAPNPAWPPTIDVIRSAGVLPLYYIATGYGSTPLAIVESEVLDAVAWYGTPSVMLDQVPTACSDVPYYQALYSFVHALGGIVM